mgnify:FL=1
MLKNLSYAKVAKLYPMCFSEENVLTFEISMKNFPIVDMLDCKANLREPFEDFLFRKVLLLLLQIVLQVSPICIIHNDAKFPSLCFIDFSESNDVRMVESFHNLRFIKSLFLFFLWHLSNVDLLNHRQALLNYY